MTDYGISGICVMNLSSLVSKALYNKKKVSVHLNFLPNLKKEEIDTFLTKRDNTLYQRTVIELLESIILSSWENAWDFVPNPTRNLRFLDFPLHVSLRDTWTYPF